MLILGAYPYLFPIPLATYITPAFTGEDYPSYIDFPTLHLLIQLRYSGRMLSELIVGTPYTQNLE